MLYKLKSVARRGTLFGAAAALAVSAFAPLAPAAYADALNPLTERSLTLSSSAPGWDYFDGSGNTTYAQPNSGANGQKTGNTFAFKTSTAATIQGMTFQYCTTSAGECLAPGDNVDPGTDVPGETSALKVVAPSAAEVTSGNFSTVVHNNASTAGTGTITTNTTDTTVTGVGTSFTTELQPGDTFTTAGSATYTVATITDNTSMTVTTQPATAEAGVTFSMPNGKAGQVKAVPGFKDPANPLSTTGQYAASQLPGSFVVYYNNAGTWTQSTGWTMTASNVENYTTDPAKQTGQNNFITLSNSTGTAFAAGQEVKVVFFGTENNYIQNPGSGAFFVKINTYDSNTTFDDSTLVDGGVTVANVMNHSIKIQTKVLETMKFSVGTVDPNTLDSTDHAGNTVPSTLEKAMFAGAELTGKTGATPHTPCDPILGGLLATDPVNVLKLGDQAAESSLSDNETYATHSYWRLSSNSSAGATVYYSGVTLSNTVGDKISAIGANKSVSTPGAEQFGLGLMNNGNGTQYEVDYTQEANENADDSGLVSVHASTLSQAGSLASWHTPRLAPLVPESNYNGGSGTFQQGGTAQFAFDESSNSVPVPLATQDNQVVDCVTAKMRYIANIAPTTPAGIYTTAVNYIAAPQY